MASSTARVASQQVPRAKTGVREKNKNKITAAKYKTRGENIRHFAIPPPLQGRPQPPPPRTPRANQHRFSLLFPLYWQILTPIKGADEEISIFKRRGNRFICSFHGKGGGSGGPADEARGPAAALRTHFKMQIPPPPPHPPLGVRGLRGRGLPGRLMNRVRGRTSRAGQAGGGAPAAAAEAGQATTLQPWGMQTPRVHALRPDLH